MTEKTLVHSTSQRARSLGQDVNQVLKRASERLVRGDLADHVPVPTGFGILDRAISGGLRKAELLLLGGPVGVGKTIASLQIARNIASRPNHYVYYLSYEHNEIHLVHRLLCLESFDPHNPSLSARLTLRDLHDLVSTKEVKDQLQTKQLSGFIDILRRDKRTMPALGRMRKYAERLILLKADPKVTTLDEIERAAHLLCDHTGGNVFLMVDYLQKVSVQHEQYLNDSERVTIVVEGLKNIAMKLEIPVWSIVAADREGLRSERMHLYHMRGSSALDYECDIAIIMINKYNLVDWNLLGASVNPGEFRNWVVFTLEKNRAGQAFQELEFELYGKHFAFNPNGKRVREKLIDTRIG